jgi:glutamate racemase
MAEENCQRRVQGHPREICLRSATDPIGVFDSGVGGLSILRALRAELPAERFVYVADSGHAPYGERDNAYVLSRSLAITEHLQKSHHIKALVVACNTATAVAIRQLREVCTDLPVIGVEPALKPAVALSKTSVVGVMATRSTLSSNKFGALLHSLQGKAQLVLQPCDGLADAIERNDATQIVALCAHYTGAMGTFGTKSGAIDMLVLGCTHYPFASEHLSALVGPEVQLVEAGAPVARQTLRILAHENALAPSMPNNATNHESLILLSTGQSAVLQEAVARWMGLVCPVSALKT